jgi:hypothetical protein
VPAAVVAVGAVGVHVTAVGRAGCSAVCLALAALHKLVVHYYLTEGQVGLVAQTCVCKRCDKQQQQQFMFISLCACTYVCALWHRQVLIYST